MKAIEKILPEGIKPDGHRGRVDQGGSGAAETCSRAAGFTQRVEGEE